MIQKTTEEQPADWDKFLPALLFAYKETPQQSVDFSPFELLYGREVLGPLAILRKCWGQEEKEDLPLCEEAECVLDLKQRMAATWELVANNLSKAALASKKHFNLKAKKQVLDNGAKVLVLFPECRNRLNIAWQGPYVVKQRVNDNNYVVEMERKKERIFHVNSMKQYIEREGEAFLISVVSEEEDDPAELPTFPLNRTEEPGKTSLGPNLSK